MVKLRLYINNLKFSMNTQCPSSHWWWINSDHQLFMQNWTVFLFNITQVCRLSTITLVYSSLSFRTIYYFRHCNFYWAHIISQFFPHSICVLSEIQIFLCSVNRSSGVGAIFNVPSKHISHRLFSFHKFLLSNDLSCFISCICALF